MEHSHRRWTIDEDAMLRETIKSGSPLSRLLDDLGRSRRAIVRRAAELGLKIGDSDLEEPALAVFTFSTGVSDPQVIAIPAKSIEEAKFQIRKSFPDAHISRISRG